jgi:hypothetical protein
MDKTKQMMLMTQTELAQAFAELIDEIWSRPWLENATIEGLLDELKRRHEKTQKENKMDANEQYLRDHEFKEVESEKRQQRINELTDHYFKKLSNSEQDFMEAWWQESGWSERKTVHAAFMNTQKVPAQEASFAVFGRIMATAIAAELMRQAIKLAKEDADIF